MTAKEIIDLLVERFETVVQRPVTIYENQELPAQPPFLIFDTIPVAPITRSLAMKAEQRGTLQITVVTDEGIGPGPAEAIAGRVMDRFQPGLLLGDRIAITEAPYIEKGYNDAGLWRLPIKIRWRVLPV